MPFHVVIVSPDELILEVDATRMFLPGKIQEIAILTDHTPLYTELTKGIIKIETTDGKSKDINIDSAICRVRQNNVSIITGFDEETEKNVKKA